MSDPQAIEVEIVENTPVVSSSTPVADLPKAYRGMAFLKVTSVKHYTDKTFSFTCKRPDAFRFRSGEFAMIGLENGERPLLRAYSIASPNWLRNWSFIRSKFLTDL